jgi:hypothetical protein
MSFGGKQAIREDFWRVIVYRNLAIIAPYECSYSGLWLKWIVLRR